MSTDIRGTLSELKEIAQEVHNLNKKLKELRERKKELEKGVVQYLDENGKPGLRLENIVFLATDKTARARKKKSEIQKDTADVLRKHGVQGDLNEVILELEASRKGAASTVPVLKMKPAGMFA